MKKDETVKRRIDELRKDVCSFSGFTPHTPKDFVRLSEVIFAKTHCNISASTLKRMLGYLHDKEYSVSRNTLDILSRFVGCSSFDEYPKRVTTNNTLQNLRMQVASIRAQLESVTEQLRKLEQEI